MVIHVGMECSIRAVGLPSKKCSPPYIQITADREQNSVASKIFVNATLSAQGVTIKENASLLSSGQRRALAIELFNVLERQPQAELVLKITTRRPIEASPASFAAPLREESKTIVLSKFREASAAEIDFINSSYERELGTAKRNFYLIVLLVLVGAAFGVWFFVRVLKFIAKRSKAAVLKAGKELEGYRVRRIAEDEAIRVTVRKSVEVAEEVDLQALKDRIKAALDAGDTETATTLLGILKKQSALSNTG